MSYVDEKANKFMDSLMNFSTLLYHNHKIKIENIAIDQSTFYCLQVYVSKHTKKPIDVLCNNLKIHTVCNVITIWKGEND